MPVTTSLLTLENPVFQVYLLGATIMILKLMIQPWMTVQRMLKVGGGYRSPEDIKMSLINPEPRQGQLEINEYVDRSRRMNLNDLESIPGFLFAGLLFVLVGPPLLLAKILIWTYVGARALHFVAYATGQLHDIRATFWSFSSFAVIGMTCYALFQAL
jgi:glutathione S-transferase